MNVEMLMSTATSFRVGPSAMLVVWTLLVLGALCGAIVTVAKGRPGWFFIGLLTGITFFYSAFLPAAPTSFWAKRSRRRHDSAS